MPVLLVPLHEFNQCHTQSGEDGGQFCSTAGGGSKGASAAKEPSTSGGGESSGRPTPVRVKTVDEAIAYLLKGRVVEVEDTQTIGTMLEKLAKMANEAKAKGEQAPDYDLCKVSVKGTNLFCAERIRNAQNPEGLDRYSMPQFTTKPKPGSAADQLPRNADGEVDGSLAFIDYLEAKGIKVGDVEEVPAALLRASQAELVGPKVAGIMTKAGYDPADEVIFVSRDNYVLDGHHRWAAVVGRDAADGRLGDSKMKAYRIDAPITELLFDAKDWTARFGLLPKAAFKKAKEARWRWGTA